MANTSTGSDNFSAAFAAVQTRPDAGPDWLRSLRETAMANFQQTGFPVQRKGNEAWKYTDLRALAQTSFAYPETRVPFPARLAASSRLTMASCGSHSSTATLTPNSVPDLICPV
jgi:hypothetical protein